MKVRFEHVTWGVQQPPILQDISLEVKSGEFYGILGPNGSGKSSLLRCLFRINRPTSGHIFLDDDDVWMLPQKTVAQKMAVLSQLSVPEIDFTVREMVEMGRIPHRGSFARASEEDESIVEDAMLRCGVKHLADRVFVTLSGGERQKVLIARAIAQQPKVLVLDEPTNHLDIRAQIETIELIQSLDLTVIAALHDLNFASSVSDRITLLKHGRIVSQGRAEDILNENSIMDVYGVHAEIFVNPITKARYFDVSPKRKRTVR